ncbi:hypothetical protein Kpol_1029p7 [Vanderwaltozyma polyspora DSM 70294]|uniref:[PSI+] induction protein 2 n=1 Tax=Vanderwaltozyma polyspora (strain ATCC 22028 / DSM 70294 / BCRC 21397 / CBS 2163 / NBRC 10782 / NRRL Y-8283 / UCD 57-17) TaxID=436907 RepID=A7TR66_VANPO|nr:uncharacterized protein Kpol_1029p7 [Vanderwaltozyma polyspora DSM 70294]EDO15234.1 hypothetical protein Kpol_1029p7 [Vanderwaltozyma polyspora DSM 70294]
MSQICKATNLIARALDVTSTADSFKSWDTCMDNKVCKIIAIVGIALASVVVLWLIGGFLTMFRQGVTGIGQFFCWCCHCGGGSTNGNSNYPPPANDNYMQNRPYMPPNAVIYQPIQHPQTAYYKNLKDDYYEETTKSGPEVYELEEDFDLEKQKERSNSRKYNKNKNNNSRPMENYSSERFQSTIYDEEPERGLLSNPNNSINDNFNSRDSFITRAMQPDDYPYERSYSPERHNPPMNQQSPVRQNDVISNGHQEGNRSSSHIYNQNGQGSDIMNYYQHSQQNLAEQYSSPIQNPSSRANNGGTAYTNSNAYSNTRVPYPQDDMQSYRGNNQYYNGRY